MDEIVDSRPLFHERNKTFGDWLPLDAPPKVPNLTTPQPDLAVGYKATNLDVGALHRLDALPRGEMLVFPVFFIEFNCKSHGDVARSENLLTGAMASRNLHAFFAQAGQADLPYNHARTVSTDSNGKFVRLTCHWISRNDTGKIVYLAKTLRSWAVEDPGKGSFREAHQTLENVVFGWMNLHYQVLQSTMPAFLAAEGAARPQGVPQYST